MSNLLVTTGNTDTWGNNEEIIFLCKSGARSILACEELIKNDFKNVKSLEGGILSWAKEVDTTLTSY